MKHGLHPTLTPRGAINTGRECACERAIGLPGGLGRHPVSPWLGWSLVRWKANARHWTRLDDRAMKDPIRSRSRIAQGRSAKGARPRSCSFRCEGCRLRMYMIRPSQRNLGKVTGRNMPACRNFLFNFEQTSFAGGLTCVMFIIEQTSEPVAMFRPTPLQTRTDEDLLFRLLRQLDAAPDATTAGHGRGHWASASGGSRHG